MWDFQFLILKSKSNTSSSIALILFFLWKLKNPFPLNFLVIEVLAQTNLYSWLLCPFPPWHSSHFGWNYWSIISLYQWVFIELISYLQLMSFHRVLLTLIYQMHLCYLFSHLYLTFISSYLQFLFALWLEALGIYLHKRLSIQEFSRFATKFSY